VSASPAGQLPSSPDTGHALIYNLSRGGLLLETAVLLNAGDMLVFDLPEAGAIAAEVIWARDGFAGCKFEHPLAQAAVSAARLRSEPRGQPDTPGIASLPPEGWNWEFTDPQAERGFVRVAAVAGLVVALVVAAAFVVALSSFPFSAR
jgi:hypothetical protein